MSEEGIEPVAKRPIFLCWQGERSKQAATIFRTWLSEVIQIVEPFLSSKDIRAGARWAVTLKSQLRTQTFGIAFITKEALDSKWIHFEAGAISKTEGSVFCLYLIDDLKTTDFADSPLQHFQHTRNTKESALALLAELNLYCGNFLTAQRLERELDRRWDELQHQLGEIPENEDGPAQRSEEEVRTELMLNAISACRSEIAELKQLIEEKSPSAVSAHLSPISKSLSFEIEDFSTEEGEFLVKQIASHRGVVSAAIIDEVKPKRLFVTISAPPIDLGGAALASKHLIDHIRTHRKEK